MTSPHHPPVMLITGGSRGIGAATALLAAQQGWRVALCYRSDAAGAQAVQQQITARGGEALALPADVTDEAQVNALFAAVIARFGRVDALINNAGVAAAPSRFEDTSPARWQALFGTNVIGTLLCSHTAVRHMSTRHGGAGGSIVQLGSIASRQGSPGRYVDYAASKGAIDSFTIGLAKEVAAEGIRVNCVRAGITQTTIHHDSPDQMARRTSTIPLQRLGQPGEIAQAIVWLCSPAATYVTGALLDASGGL